MKSILQTERECYLSGRTDWLEEHHIFYGQGRRKLSEQYGLKVWLNHYWHNEPPTVDCPCGGVHFNRPCAGNWNKKDKKRLNRNIRTWF